MAKARKTVDVKDLKDYVNYKILNSDNNVRLARETLILLISKVLHDAGQYNGFNYLSPEMMKASACGTSYGINPDKPEDKRFDGADNTRVFFY